MTLGVNVASGNLLLQQTDLDVSGAGGHDLAISRTYNSQTGADRQGLGWSFNFGADEYLQKFNNGKTLLLFGPGNEPWRFSRSGTSWISPPGINATATDAADGGIDLMFHGSGETWHFGGATASGKGGLAYKRDRNGHTITYGFDAAKQYATSITDTGARTYSIARDSTTHRVTGITDPAYSGGARTLGYAFSDFYSEPRKLLTTYTDAAGRPTTYGYNTNGLLTQVTDPAGRKTLIDYGSSADAFGVWRAQSVTRMTNTNFAAPVGPKTQYCYAPGLNTVVLDPIATATGASCDNPGTRKTTYDYDQLLEVTSAVDAKGYQSDTKWTANSDADQFTDQAQTGSGIIPAVTDLSFSSDGSNNLTDGQLAGDGGSRESFSNTFFAAGDTFGGQPANPATGSRPPPTPRAISSRSATTPRATRRRSAAHPARCR